jgi:uncharacterized protein DUF1707
MSRRAQLRDLRASDTDRDRVVTMLGVAVSDGRLTPDEHTERVEAALSARTLGDLERLTTDLASAAEQPVRLDGGKAVSGFFGTEVRNGRWVVPQVLTCSAVFGEVVADFREALLEDTHVILYAYVFGGRVRLIVPAGVEVVMGGTMLLGRCRGATADSMPSSPDVPVIEVRAFAAGGEVVAQTPPRQRRWLRGWRRTSLP